MGIDQVGAGIDTCSGVGPIAVGWWDGIGAGAGGGGGGAAGFCCSREVSVRCCEVSGRVSRLSR